MCGIAGLVSQTGQPVDAALLRRMTSLLAHRGPDGEALHVDGAVGLGHRRLAIIDLSTGDQPMTSADGATTIVYNGEVYNYRELRRELESLGRRFRTESDTEVVLQAYEVWGAASLARLRGMFAFAVSDRRRRCVLLARDRVGIKPLVYAWDGRRLAFASELKALLEDPTVPRDLDATAVGDYFTHHYIGAPRTIFSAIRKLPPASYLMVPLDGGEPTVHGYWSFRMAPDPRVSDAAWVEGLDAVLTETVRLHMVSDVPVGAFLSGGVDSSAVVACMARTSGARVKTFSIGFDDESFDELAYARLVAARYGTDHFEMIVKPDVVSVLPRLTWQFDEPFADSSAVPTYCVSRITRDHVTVALSGDGGDESFAGYARYAQALALGRRTDRLPLPALRPLFSLAAACMPAGMRGRGALELYGMGAIDRYQRLMSFQRDDMLGALLTPDMAPARASAMARARYRDLAAAAGTRSPLSVMQHVDIHHYLPDDILAKVDRASMLTSLESRVPLLDHVLMEYVATMPESLKYRAGTGKWVLKRAMAPHLPAEILTRRKMGFGVPLAEWLRKDLREMACDTLLDPRARQRGILNPATVARMLERHLDGSRDFSAQIWALLSFELWCRQWWDR